MKDSTVQNRLRHSWFGKLTLGLVIPPLLSVACSGDSTTSQPLAAAGTGTAASNGTSTGGEVGEKKRGDMKGSGKRGDLSEVGSGAVPGGGGSGTGGTSGGGEPDCVPEDELCDGIDNDCDGEVDEDFPELGASCDGEDEDSCANGVFVCSFDGTGVVCSGDHPGSGVITEELCDGIDNDCDGEADEGYPVGAPCDSPEDSDLCANGTYACSEDGTGVVCVGDNSTGTTEVCDGVDNDCDGLTDEGEDENVIASFVPGVGVPCGSNVGACVPGVQRCRPKAGGGYALECVGGVGPSKPSCAAPNDDRNCNGMLDVFEENAEGCTAHYVDKDGDGYGVGSSKCLCPYLARKERATSQKPDPYASYTATKNGDCCDEDARAFPGQTLCFDTPRSQCGGFDFDCKDGEQKCQVQTNVNPNQCADNCANRPGWDTLLGCPKACGAQGHWIEGWGLLCAVTDYKVVRQKCR